MADQPNVLDTPREGILLPGGCAGITPNAARTKVTACHLKREAFLYVRQSTLHQVMQNTESTQRHAEGVRSSNGRSLSGGPWIACM